MASCPIVIWPQREGRNTMARPGWSQQDGCHKMAMMSCPTQSLDILQQQVHVHVERKLNGSSGKVRFVVFFPSSIGLGMFTLSGLAWPILRCTNGSKGTTLETCDKRRLCVDAELQTKESAAHTPSDKWSTHNQLNPSSCEHHWGQNTKFRPLKAPRFIWQHKRC